MLEENKNRLNIKDDLGNLVDVNPAHMIRIFFFFPVLALRYRRYSATHMAAIRHVTAG